jgi:pyruvate,water dikinase
MHHVVTAANVLWLDDPVCSDRRAVGGKAANLSRLAASHRVPPGFCLTTGAFERAKAASTGGRWDRSLPPGLQEELAQAYLALSKCCGMDLSVAVRSSAADEDTAGASFAGQYETQLNVRGVEAVADAVARCWASTSGPRVRAYRRQRGLPQRDSPMAVLIQQLVVPDVSAIVFSMNPLTGDSGQVVISASWGLGESVVGGTVTPDTYVVRRTDLRMLDSQVADKQRMTVAVPGGTTERNVPRFLRRRPCLDTSQAADVTRLACAIEQTMGWPVDLECALAGGDLYLLQCRPISSFGEVR